MTDFDDVDALLRFDPLHAAERATGGVFRDDPATATLGLALALDSGDRKRAALQATGDTWTGMPFGEHMAVYGALGFEIVLDELFHGTGGVTERFAVLWRPDGVLAACESYAATDSTNSSSVYYNWRPHEIDQSDRWYPAVSSGGLREGVWVGDHDVRDGLRHKLADLQARGSFVAPWPHPHRTLWLTTYAERRETTGDLEAVKRVAAARLGRLPQRVREAVNV